MKIYKTRKQIIKQINKINAIYQKKNPRDIFIEFTENEEWFYISVDSEVKEKHYFSFDFEPMQIGLRNNHEIDEEQRDFFIHTKNYWFEISTSTGNSFSSFGGNCIDWREEEKKIFINTLHNDLKKISQ